MVKGKINKIDNKNQLNKVSPLVSIITTIKDGEQYIRETLESVLNQTYTNYEHIIVDDGSKDNSIDVIESFIKVHSDYPLRLYVPGNLGRGGALNYAVSKAKGRWVAILDADDLWHPQKLEIQWKCISNNNIDVLGTGSCLFTQTRELKFDKFDKEGKIQYFKMNDLLKSNKLSHSSVLIRKEFCNYDEYRRSQFDYELWLQIGFQDKYLGKINQNLSFHRIHNNQSFESNKNTLYVFNALKLKLHYCIKSKQIHLIPFILIRVGIALIIPRRLKLLINKK